MGFIIAGAVILLIVLLLLLPVHLVVRYPDKESSVDIYARVLLFKFRIDTDKKKKKKKKPGKSKDTVKSESTAEKRPDIKSTIDLIREIAEKLFGKFGRHLKIRVYRFYITVGCDDAAKTAMTVGGLNALCVPLFEVLGDSLDFKFRCADAGVYPDYLSERITADIKIDFSMNVANILSTLMSAAMVYAKKNAKINDKQER